MEAWEEQIDPSKDYKLKRYDSTGASFDNPINVVNSTEAVKILGTWGKPFYLGTYALWVSSSGKSMIKNGAPSSDTDGTIVGTQL
ncbi:hypothetical protein ACFQZ1_02280 [Bacillus sp. CGMCC 1.60114]